MIAITSPAKTQDFESKWSADITSQVDFLDETAQLNLNLKKKSVSQLMKLMRISQKLGELNYSRYQGWRKNHTKNNSKPAILAFKGDIYREFDSSQFTKTEQEYLQNHLRIISGFYGILRPYDLMQAYRLEMKIKLSGKGYQNLYEFWGSKLTEHLNQALKYHPDKVILNLASLEYFKAIQKSKLDGKVLQVEFRQRKNGEINNFGIYAKRARGEMIRFMIENKITQPSDLKGFNLDGYSLFSLETTKETYTFVKSIS